MMMLLLLLSHFSCVWLFETPWITAHQASPSITIFWSSLKLRSIESVKPSSHLILRRPLFLLPPIPPPNIRVFSNESTLCMRWPKYWSFSFSIIPSKEHPGLISFRMVRTVNFMLCVFYHNNKQIKTKWANWTTWHSYLLSPAELPEELAARITDAMAETRCRIPSGKKEWFLKFLSSSFTTVPCHSGQHFPLSL